MSALPQGSASLKHRSQAMTEDELLQGLLDACYVGGWLVHHVRRSDLGLQQGHAGFPDIVAVHPKRASAVFLECKSSTGRLTALQQEWLDAFDAALAGSVAVVTPEDYDEWVQRLLAHLLDEKSASATSSARG